MTRNAFSTSLSSESTIEQYSVELYCPPAFPGMPLNGFLRQRAHPIVASFNHHKVLLYGLVSTIAVSATITNALRCHSNFYSVAIYLSKSNRSVLVSDISIVIHGVY
jgi:hypothetical protein